MRLDADDEDDAFGNGKIPVGVVATPQTSASGAPGTQVSDSYNDLSQSQSQGQSLSQSQMTDATNSTNGDRAVNTDGGEG